MSVFRYLLALLFCAVMSAHAAPKQKINPPPAVELAYDIKAEQRGIPLTGSAVVRWSTDNNRFTASSEARSPLLGKFLSTKSEGTIDSFGLAPSSFVQKRLRKEPTTTTFDRATNTISFTATDDAYPINGGEQDHNSVIWQLISLARATPAKFKPGTSWNVFVAGPRHASEWIFRIVAREKVSTPLGTVNALHIARELPSGSKDQKLDIWLAPSLEWYPVRLRYTEDDGDYIEQTLQQITRKPK